MLFVLMAVMILILAAALVVVSLRRLAQIVDVFPDSALARLSTPVDFLESELECLAEVIARAEHPENSRKCST